MIRSNNTPQSGYIRLQQESDYYEDEEYNSLSDHDYNSQYIFNKPRYQRRSLPDSRHPHIKFQFPRMEAAPYESDQDNSGSNSISSTWSQLKKWRLKGKGKGIDKSDLEIYNSVFEIIPTLQDWKPNTPPLTPNHEEPLSQQKFIEIVESVKAAIVANIQPTRISQGSSGSYFCRNKEGKVVGVFKPKNEEPYGQLNPKWTKWIHRNLFPCFFGRSCLIPNLGYISESAASLLDRRLLLNIVPVTEVIWISSPSFHYDYLDRRAARLKKPLPDKIGSFQVFLDGFKDASIFLREYPWPDSNAVITNDANAARQNRRLNALMCGRAGVVDNEEETSESYQLGRRFVWTSELQLQFREQFEKLIILDYLMRNTDRSFDNWMIKYCDEQTCKNTLPTSKVMKTPDILSKDNAKDNFISIPAQETNGDVPPPLSPDVPDGSEPSSPFSEPPLQSDNQDNPLEPVSSVSSPPSISSQHDLNPSRIPYPHIHVAAIDNGLAFPFKHPDQWRSYPYGWLYLPEFLIKQPFTANTRNHFLSMLSDPKWWKETVAELRRLFALDTDFEPGMFAKQIAVLKGQGWNIVETLKQPDQGPCDLCARQNVMVWDDVEIIEIPLGRQSVNNSNANEVDIVNTEEGTGNEEEEEERGNTSSGYIPAPKRSLSDDYKTRPPLSTSAPTSLSFTATSSSNKQKWSDKLKEKLEKFNFDKNKDKYPLERKKTKKVIVERLEPVSGGTPFFTWC